MKTLPRISPHSDSTPHQIHLQHHLITYTTYTIIATHKQIWWANRINLYIEYTYIHTTQQKNSILWFNNTWPPPCWPCSTSSSEYLKMSCCHNR